MNIWDQAARWSARRWLRRLESQLPAGWRHSPTTRANLDGHTAVVRAQLATDAAGRLGMVPAPAVVLLACYAEVIQDEAVAAGWRPPPDWTRPDGIARRLLVCCHLARTL